MTQIVLTATSCDSGGSGSGTSYYEKVEQCPRRASYDKDSEKAPLADAPFAIQVGIITHKLFEIWLKNNSDDIVVEVDDLSLDQSVTEAQRLFKGLVQVCKKQHFGEILGVELQVPTKNIPGVAFAVGLESWTGRYDARARLSAEDVEYWKDFGAFLPGPGVYIWDLKTHTDTESDPNTKYNNSNQLHLYQMADEAEHGEKPLGAIALNVYAHGRKKKAGPRVEDLLESGSNGRSKYRSFEAVYVSPPSEVRKHALRNWLQRKYTEAQGAECRLSACIDRYSKVCRHLTSGRCNQT